MIWPRCDNCPAGGGQLTVRDHPGCQYQESEHVNTSAEMPRPLTRVTHVSHVSSVSQAMSVPWIWIQTWSDSHQGSEPGDAQTWPVLALSLTLSRLPTLKLNWHSWLGFISDWDIFKVLKLQELLIFNSQLTKVQNAINDPFVSRP